MSEDIVARLRDENIIQSRRDREEAADEIERLRAELHSVHAHLQHYRDMLAAERERCAQAAYNEIVHANADLARRAAAAIRKGEQ